MVNVGTAHAYVREVGDAAVVTALKIPFATAAADAVPVEIGPFDWVSGGAGLPELYLPAGSDVRITPVTEGAV